MGDQEDFNVFMEDEKRKMATLAFNLKARALEAAAPWMLEALKGLERGDGDYWCEVATDYREISHTDECLAAGKAVAMAERRDPDE